MRLMSTGVLERLTRARWPESFGPLPAIALVWLGYYLLGRVSLLLAIPPGYATPIWPAAGLALAGLLMFGMRAWPGIALASLCLNTPLALASFGDPARAIALAGALAAGATLQALTGVLLLRRFVGPASSLLRINTMIPLLALGGPLACVVAPALATVALLGLGAIERADAAYNAFTWWIGDGIGVLVVMPLYLTWLTPLTLLKLRTKLMASVPMLVLLALVTLLFLRTSALEQARKTADFEQRSDRVVAALQREFVEFDEVLHAVAAVQTATDADLDRGEFRMLAGDILARHQNLHALSWAPRVAGAQRGVFEQTMRTQGITGFEIRDMLANGTLVPAKARGEYFPVTWIEPQQANVLATGFDLASQVDRRRALRASRRSGEPAVTAQVDLVQLASGEPGVIFAQPAYWSMPAEGQAASQSPPVRGYVTAVLLVHPAMTRLLQAHQASDVQVRLLDTNAGPAAAPLYVNRRAVADAGNPAAQSRSVTIEVGGRPWQLDFTQPPIHSATSHSPLAWSVLVAGMLFTALFSAFLLAMVGRTALVEARVRTRTAELEYSNNALRLSLEQQARTQAALARSKEQARAVIDTAREAYVSTDASSRVIGWNREAETTFGWTREEAVGRTLTELIIPPPYRAAHAQGVAPFLATGEGHVLNQRLELTAQHRDGRTFPVELTIWTTRDGDSHQFHAFLHDISARRRAAQRLQAQQGAAAALLQSPTLAIAAPRVLESVCMALEWRVGAVWMLDEGHDRLACCEVWEHPEAPAPLFVEATRIRDFARGTGLPGRVWDSGAPLWIADVTTDSNFPRAASAARDGLHAAFAVPILSGTAVLGVVEFFSDTIEAPDADLLALMDTLGHLLGEFVCRKRAEAALFEEKERAEVTLGSIGDGVVVTDAGGRVTYLNPIAQDMTGWPLVEARGLPVVDVLRLVDRDSGEATLNPLLTALRENRTLGIAVDSELVRRDGMRSPIENSAAPIHDRSGAVVGSVMVFHDISESRAMALKMSHLAQHDYLTDLPNRVLLQDRFSQGVAHAVRNGVQLAVLYMDLDGFKHINDSLGHEVGDRLLQQVAKRLQDCVRGVDTVSRQGGDEFVVLLPDLHSNHAAARIAEHILEAIRLPFDVDGQELNVTLSIGIATFPDDDSDPGVLMKYADAAMYRAKQEGHDCYRFYTRAISEQADRRLQIESELHRALRNNEFVLHYQPKVAPDSGRILGMEALVRWMPPDGVLRMPAEFIEIAEESGLIARIDAWVIEEACRQNAAWQAMGLMPVSVAVNLAAAHTRSDRYPTFLKGVLERTGLAPEYLQIELTETQLLHDTDRFELLIRGMKSLGVKVAIDDFGTGYSSIGYLQRFPFDVLKIDKSFVQALSDGSRESIIVDAITRLAHAFSYVVVAEGVETLDQARILQAHGCHEMQGYLYSRPVPPTQMADMLRARNVQVGTRRA